MKAAIIAGGRGKRMGEATKLIPKPMLPIGGKPLLEHQVELLVSAGITDITICTGYLSHAIEEHFGNGDKWQGNIAYCVEDVPLGTAGCLRLAFPRCEGPLVVVYGDVMVHMDLGALVEVHRKAAAAATLVVHPNDHPYDSDLLEVDSESRIVSIHSKPHPEGAWLPNLVNACVYVLEPEIVDLIPTRAPSDFAHHIFPAAIRSGLGLHAYRTAEYLKDIGTPQRYEMVKQDWDTGRILRSHRKNPRPALFMDRDGVIVDEVGLLHDVRGLELMPGAPEALKEINASDFLAILITNQPVIARGLCTIADLQLIHNKLETLLGRQGAKLDAIYYCPHHPDSGYEG